VAVGAAGADGENRAGRFGDDIVGGGERDVAGPAGAGGFRTHHNQVGGAFLGAVENFLRRSSKAHAEIRGDKGAVEGMQGLAHVLGVDLAEVVQFEAAGSFGGFDDVERGEGGRVFAREGDGVDGSALGTGAKVSDKENAMELDLGQILGSRGRTDGENRASSVAENLLGAGTEGLRTAGKAVRAEDEEVDGVAMNQLVDGIPKLTFFDEGNEEGRAGRERGGEFFKLFDGSQTCGSSIG